MEIGLSIRPVSAEEELADVAAAEAQGFAAATYGDSQCAFADPFVRMSRAAAATSTIRLVTCGVPPRTRHAAVTASAALSVHRLSGGRAVLGMARGDSALWMIGMDYPVPMAEFTPYADEVTAYARGAVVDKGRDSSLGWFPKGLPPMPVEYSATGPRMIRWAAAHADRVTFFVGGAPERIAWALALGRAAAAEAGRAPGAVRFGCWLNVAVCDDVDAGLAAMRVPAILGAKFSSMRGAAYAEQPEILRRVSRPLGEILAAGRPFTEVQTADARFVDWFAAVGPAPHVTDRIQALADLGLDFVHVIHANSDPALTEPSRAALADEVLPKLRKKAT